MITTNFDVSDGLTKGALGFVSNIVVDTLSQDIKAILVVFDNSDVGEDARSRSLYKCKVQPHHVLLGYPFHNTAAHT